MALKRSLSTGSLVRRIAVRLAWTAVAALSCGATPPDAWAQGPCDPALPRNDAQSTGYHPRGDRCEGVYKRPVASFGIQLVSLTAQSGVSSICTAGEPTHMIWPAATPAALGAGPVHVMAESLRPLLYYRLDVDRQAGASAFEWPQDPRCSNDVALTAGDVGILARTHMTLRAKPIEVLLPVGLSRQPTAAVRPPYQAALMPGRRLREVYVSLWLYGSAPNPTPVIVERALSMRPYPAGTRVTIPFSAEDVAQPGVYRARASVEFETGEVEALEFYFLHGR